MRRMVLRGSSHQSGTDLRVEVVPQDDGNLLAGYVRVSHNSVGAPSRGNPEDCYLGALSVPKLLRVADAIRRRHSRWLDGVDGSR